MNQKVQHNINDLITQLESLIASLQEKITDPTIQQFLLTVDLLIREFRGDKTVATLLKMIQSIGKYVEKKKEKTHQDTFSALKYFVKSIISVQGSDFSNSEKQKLLQENLKELNLLKQKIAVPLSDKARIDELKTVLLSLEWEINPITIALYKRTVSDLKETWNNSKLFCSFLNILNILGKYVDHQQANSHQGALQLIRKIYDHLEFIVLNPWMPFEKKKQILVQDIEKINIFKAAVARKSNIPPQKAETPALQPALSQYKHSIDSHRAVSDEFIPLSDDQAIASDNNDADSIETAEISSDTNHTDVMDDLFNPKASPVDELLDKIHLMNVLGKNKSTGMTSQEDDSVSSMPGVKKFTPRRIDKEPIPEISNRIDEFFNLDTMQPDGEKNSNLTPDINLNPESVRDEETEPESYFNRLHDSIEQAILSMTFHDIDHVIKEISQLDNMFLEDPSKKPFIHSLILSSKLIEKLSGSLLTKQRSVLKNTPPD